MNGFWIVWSNSGGELDRRFARSEEEAAEVMIAMLQDCLHLAAGDSIRVEDGWSEAA